MLTLSARRKASPSAAQKHRPLEAAGPSQITLSRGFSTEEANPLLFSGFSFGFRLRRQLQHARRLAFAQKCQEYDASIGKFERIMVCCQLVLVDLAEDGGGVVDCLCFPAVMSA